MGGDAVSDKMDLIVAPSGRDKRSVPASPGGRAARPPDRDKRASELTRLQRRLAEARARIGELERRPNAGELTYLKASLAFARRERTVAYTFARKALREVRALVALPCVPAKLRKRCARLLREVARYNGS
jgi:hypothetical protein